MEYNLDDDLFDDTLCKTCEHLVSRNIIPINYEEFGIDIDKLREELEDDEEVVIVHNTCIVLHMDLDHVVLSCNKFKEQEGSSIFSKKPW